MVPKSLNAKETDPHIFPLNFSPYPNLQCALSISPFTTYLFPLYLFPYHIYSFSISPHPIYSRYFFYFFFISLSRLFHIFSLSISPALSYASLYLFPFFFPLYYPLQYLHLFKPFPPSPSLYISLPHISLLPISLHYPSLPSGSHFLLSHNSLPLLLSSFYLSLFIPSLFLLDISPPCLVPLSLWLCSSFSLLSISLHSLLSSFWISLPPLPYLIPLYLSSFISLFLLHISSLPPPSLAFVASPLSLMGCVGSWEGVVCRVKY
jgi:hypothetical protein